MNIKITISLILIALVVGVVVYINPFKSEDIIVEQSPWFYQVAKEDIIGVNITNKDNVIKFYKEDKTWFIKEPNEYNGIPAAWEVFQGVDLLLSGPRTQRDLTISSYTIEDPVQYGLDAPEIIVDVELTSNRFITFKLGNKTPNEDYFYGEVVGFPQLYMVAEIWGRVVGKLALNPPLPQWYLPRDISQLVSTSLKKHNSDSDQTNADIIEFVKENDEWFVKDYRLAISPDKVKINADINDNIIPLFSGSPNIKVENPRVEDQDYSPWGINEQTSDVIAVRFPAMSVMGTEYVEEMALLIGNKTPDNKGYYALWVAQQFFRPVIILDSNWVETLLDVFNRQL